MQLAKRKFQKENLEFSVQSIYGNGVEQKYDLVISNMVLEHVSNQHEYINKLYNLLEKDGILLLSVPNRYSIWKEAHYDIFFLS